MDNEIISRLDSIAARLQAIEQRLFSGSTPSPIVTDSGIVPQAVPRPLSVSEYVLAKRPADDNQRTLVLASYLEVYKTQPDFVSDELRQAFIDSRIKVPANVNDKIGKLVQKGWMMLVGERDGKKTWCLTMTGIAVIEEGFGK